MDVTWQEEEAQKYLDYLETFMNEKKDAAGRLPDGPWVDACRELTDILEGCWDEPFSKTTLARKEMFFAWVAGLSKPKLMADEVMEAEKNTDLLDAFGEMSGAELVDYYKTLEGNEE